MHNGLLILATVSPTAVGLHPSSVALANQNASANFHYELHQER